MAQQVNVTNPAQALRITRFLWVALLLGQIVLIVVALFVRRSDAGAPASEFTPIVFYASLAMLACCAPAAFVIRRVVFGNATPVPPQKYVSGSLLFFALLEGASLFGIVTIFLGVEPTKAMIVPFVAIAIAAINFPNGVVMEDTRGKTSMPRK